ncbi:MAG: coproporphyrinogen dehydrogenase HemZ [Firmicutes bacterium]|nr:coproporphyrinogen dehydrogenase HemZ [Bacillota bacterium]
MINKPWGTLAGVRPAKLIHRLLDQGLDYTAALRIMQEQRKMSQSKFDLLWNICQVERPFVVESSQPHLFSLYVGIPFCPTRCLYCSFPSHSLTELGKLRGQFIDALLQEIAETGALTQRLGLQPYTVYIGGGTPTSLTAEELERIIMALTIAFPSRWREFTVEAGRPDTLTSAHVDMMAKHGVNRVCVNPQTMHQQTLDLIGRRHSPEDIITAVAAIRQVNIKVLNMDLIVGLPGEDSKMVEESMRQLITLAPENVTLHVFSRKRASRYNEVQADFTLPSPAAVVEMHNMATAVLAQQYRPYYLYRQREILGGLENIGYAMPGTECGYNIAMIEERHHIIGLGGGASSKYIRPDFTLKNMSSPKDVRIYLQRLDELSKRREVELLAIRGPLS